jgi:uncharacterized phage-associated protein
MLTCFDVAKYFLNLANCIDDERELISNLKLQKLIYYAQGFSLAINDKPLFEEPIEAWQHGPVVSDLYHHCKEYGSEGIPCPIDFDLSKYSNDDIELLEEVYSVYGQFSAWKLRNMTHEEIPWKDAIIGDTIPHGAMQTYFKTMIVEQTQKSNLADRDSAKRLRHIPDEWQPMETAPRDKRVMVWSGQEMYCAHWAQNPMKGDEAWIIAEWGTEGDQALVKPTHWHPLPLPPNEEITVG